MKYLLPPIFVTIDGAPGLHIKRLTTENMSKNNPYVAAWQEQRLRMGSQGLAPSWSHSLCSPVAGFVSLEEAGRDLVRRMEEDGYEFLTEEQANRLMVML